MKKFVLIALMILLAACNLTACKNELSSPSNVTVNADSDGFITITWQASDTAEEYRIYRRVQGEDDYKFLSDVQDCHYEDRMVEDGRTYAYKVEAMTSSARSKGIESSFVTVCKSEDTENTSAKSLSTPVITTVTRMDPYTAVICFEGSENGNYEILRSETPDGTYQQIGKTEESLYYDDTATKDYYYKVQAVDHEERSNPSTSEPVKENPDIVFSVPVMMYHEFVTQADLNQGVLFDEYAIWASEFEADLQWLKANGYTTITTKELIQYMNGDTKPPEKPIILTIDDGKYGVYKRAYPLLKKYNMTAVLSIIGSEIEKADTNPDDRKTNPAPYCTWAEIKEMSDSGSVEIISHTYGLHVFSHDNRCGANSAAGETADEYFSYCVGDYLTVQTVFRDILETDLTAMAYPYSKRSKTADEAWLTCGYQILYAGDSVTVRKTGKNYYIAGAGINKCSSLTRRVARMHGTSIDQYLNDMN